MSESEGRPVFLECEAVIDAHELALSDSGGLPGIRDRNALESAVHAPQQAFDYGGAGLEELAAVYLFAIAKNHAFNDANKRTAYLACLIFLKLNGVDLGSPNTLEIATLAVAANFLDRTGLTGLIRALIMLRESDPEYYRAVHARE